MRSNYEPWTEKPLLEILPGFVKMTGPQCGWLTNYLMEPGSSKFFYYFMLSGWTDDKDKRIRATKALMDLSERELHSMIEKLRISDESLSLCRDAKLIEMWELEIPVNENRDKLLASRAQSLALEQHTVIRKADDLERDVF